MVRPKIKFILKNDTSKDLNLKVFGKSKLLSNINIKSQSSFDTTVTYASPGSNNQNSPFDVEKVDSIVVVFSDSKAIITVCKLDTVIRDCWNNTPMFFTLKSTKKLKPESSKVFAYEEKDYADAKPL
jgi:hypothetical protein